MSDRQEVYSLLLVDDNPTNLQLMSQIIGLDLPHVRVYTATGAVEGLKLVAEHQIDGAFIDVQMPGMDGLEMCRQLRMHPRTARIPLVLMTAHIASPALRAEGLEVGAYHFISKPISNLEMLARIKVMLRLCENERAQTSNSIRLQQQVESHSIQLRWLSGLLISGGGALTAADQLWLRQLMAELPPVDGKDEEAFYEKLVTEMPRPWQRTLYKLSLLESISVPLAERLSEIADIGAGLDYLKRHHLSLIQVGGREDCLLFQPHIRKLLRARAKQLLSDKERLDVYLTAADWYRQQGQLLPRIDSLVRACHYDEVSQLLSQSGLKLLDQKNAGTSLQILDQIPDDIAARCGWQSLFRGIVRLENLGADAELWLELASQHFHDNGDTRGLVLTWSWQALQAIYVRGAWDEWQARHADFSRRASEVLPALEVSERLTVAHALGMTHICFAGDLEQASDLLAWALAEAQQAQLQPLLGKLQLLRCRQALHQGRSLVARTTFEQACNSMTNDKSFLVSLMLHQTAFDLLLTTGTLSGLYQQQTVFAQDCSSRLYRQTMAEPLYGYYTATLQFVRNQPELAEQAIDSALISARTVNSNHLQSLLLQLRGWIRAASGRDNAALVDLEQGLKLREQAGGLLCRLENLLLAGATCMALGRNEQACTLLTEALALSEQLGEERLRPGICAWLAIARRRDQREKSDEHLRTFFELLRRQHNRFFCGLTADLLRQLLPLLSTAAERDLLAPLLEKYLGAELDETYQPLEMIDIVTLGDFKVRKGENHFDLRQVGQSSRSMLAQLLMTPQHALSTEVLMGQLWPDSPSVKARNNFDAAHSRLRKSMEEALGRDVRHHYLVLTKGILSLNRGRIDALAYERNMETARYHYQREHYWQAEQSLWIMERLWGGEFLSGFELDDSLARHRDRYNHVRLEQLELLARLLIRRRSFQQACVLLRSGLSLDPAADAIVRLLLEVYQAQADHRAAERLLRDYGRTLKQDGYENEEIEELIESFGLHWLNITDKIKESWHHGEL